MELMCHSSKFLLPRTEDKTTLKYALIILNQSLPRFTPLLWDHAKLRICADGGANRLFDDLPSLFPHLEPADVRNRYKPDVIKGDLDSVREDVRDFYAKLGTKVVDEGNDQNTTDLHKCVAFVRDSTPQMELSNLCILVAGATGGRFDHEIGNINPSVEGPHCGLIPIGMTSLSTTTTGLQWNLTDAEMKFGGLVSTSNIAKEEKITVQSESDLLWTISIKSSKG